MATRIIKVGVNAGDQIPIDTVEKLLQYVVDGDDIAVFTSEGEVVFVAPSAGDFEEIG